MPISRASRGIDTDKAIKHISRAVLFLLLYNILVTFVYGASGPEAIDRFALGAASAQAAEGDSNKQILYLLFSGIMIALHVYTHRKNLFDIPISIAYNLACFWCLISFTWALVPDTSFRRAVGMYLVLLAVSGCVSQLGAKETIRVIYVFLALLIPCSLISIALSSIDLFSFAVHPLTEGDPGVAGAWKGVMFHKNVAGAVMVHSIIFFLHHVINRGKKLDWILLILSVIFLIGTKSKTSYGLLSFAIMAGLSYRYLYIRGKGILFNYAILFIVIVLALFAYILRENIYAFLTDPDSLTGRTQIWASLLPFIESHFWLGSGYGSFWSIGDRSPIFSLALTDFISGIGHSHSGYFEIILTTGAIGLGLALISLIFLPLYRFFTPSPPDVPLYAMLFSIWTFGIFQNFTESQFFAADKQSWLFVVISITIVHCRALSLRKRAFDALASEAWFPSFRPSRPSRGRGGARILAQSSAGR